MANVFALAVLTLLSIAAAKSSSRGWHRGCPDRRIRRKRLEVGCFCRTRCPPMAFSLPPVSETNLWAIRLGSAVVSYIGLVSYFDRPQGHLFVDDSSVVVKDSSVEGAGLGLFARKELSSGTLLGTYPGVVIPIQQNLEKLRKFPQCEGFVWRFSDNRYVIDPTDSIGELRDFCIGGTMTPGSRWISETLLKRAVPTTLCRINEPPLGRDVNVVTSEDLSERKVTFVLERDVFPGEELFIDYGLYYDRSSYKKIEPF